jgi:hypothetical protein
MRLISKWALAPASDRVGGARVGAITGEGRALSRSDLVSHSVEKVRQVVQLFHDLGKLSPPCQLAQLLGDRSVFSGSRPAIYRTHRTDHSNAKTNAMAFTICWARIGSSESNTDILLA